MKSHVIIRATFKHGDDTNSKALKDGVLIGMRDAFQDDLKVTGDIIIEPWLKRKEIIDKLREHAVVFSPSESIDDESVYGVEMIPLSVIKTLI